MTNSSHSKSSSTPYSLNAEESSKQYKNKYSDRKLLGEGGMGQVFELKDLQIQRPVAIKMMKPELQSDPKAEQRFINEARITGRLEHPNIIPIHELSRNNDGLPYYTTKLIKGLDLKDILIGLQEEEPKFIKNYSLNNLISIFLKVCDAIAFSHSQNIIHRDLKLENIMIGEFGEVLVVDWGLAKDLSIDESTDLIAKQKQTSLTERVELTLDGEIVGTPQYMSPEQAGLVKTPVDQRSDIFSLGVILYRLLSLNKPINEVQTKKLFSKLQKGDFIDLESWNPNVQNDPQRHMLHHCPGQTIPDGLIAVCKKAIRLKANERYQTVAELQKDLLAWQQGFATSTQNLSFFGQIKLWYKRHSQLAHILMSGTALGLVLLIFFIVHILSERQFNQDELKRLLQLEQIEQEKAAAINNEIELHLSSARFAQKNKQWSSRIEQKLQRSLFLNPSHEEANQLMLEYQLFSFHFSMENKSWERAAEHLEKTLHYGLLKSTYLDKQQELSQARNKQKTYTDLLLTKLCSDARLEQRHISERDAIQQLIQLKSDYLIDSLRKLIRRKERPIQNLAIGALSLLYKSDQADQVIHDLSQLSLYPKLNGEKLSFIQQELILRALLIWGKNSPQLLPLLEYKIYFDDPKERLRESLEKQLISWLRQYKNPSEIQSFIAFIQQNSQAPKDGEDLNLAIEEQPLLFSLYKQRAELLQSDDNFVQAKSDWSHLIKRYPKVADFLFQRAQISELSDKLSDLNKAIQINFLFF